MSLVSFQDLMREAESGNYAVGYFESWNLESLLAVADAATQNALSGNPGIQRDSPP